MELQRKQQLLMGLIDDELNAEEVREIRELLRRDQQLREEYEQLLSVNDELKLIGDAQFDELMLRKVWRSPFRKSMRRMSYLMIGGGFSALLIFATWEYLKHGEKNMLPAVATCGIGLGIILLFLQVVRDRMLILKNDPYREVEK